MSDRGIGIRGHKDFDQDRQDCRRCGNHWDTYALNRDTSSNLANKKRAKAYKYGICSICAEKRWRRERQRMAAEAESKRLDLEEQKWRMLQ